MGPLDCSKHILTEMIAPSLSILIYFLTYASFKFHLNFVVMNLSSQWEDSID